MSKPNTPIGLRREIITMIGEIHNIDSLDKIYRYILPKYEKSKKKN